MMAEASTELVRKVAVVEVGTAVDMVTNTDADRQFAAR
jgi:hypothetical protein